MKLPALEDLLRRYPQLSSLSGELAAAFQLLEACVSSGHTILACGNGGSAADAEHVVGELMKSFAFKRPIPADDRQRILDAFPDATELVAALEVGIPAVSLVGQVGLATAIANDIGYAYTFAQQVYGLGRPGDVLLAISTSGNSKNVVNACQVARARGIGVIALTGGGGGRMAGMADVALRVPETETHLIQELHLPIYHFLCWALEERFFGEFGPKA